MGLYCFASGVGFRHGWVTRESPYEVDSSAEKCPYTFLSASLAISPKTGLSSLDQAFCDNDDDDGINDDDDDDVNDGLDPSRDSWLNTLKLLL